VTRTPFVVLVALNLLLGAAIAALWWTGDRAWQAPSPVYPDASLFAVPDADSGDPLLDADIEGRPLFASSRRPAPEEKAEEAPKAPPAAGDPFKTAKLAGLAGKDQQGVALVSLDDELHRVSVGGELAGWRLDRIAGLVATFENAAGERRQLSVKPPPRELPKPQPQPLDAP
jgi:hypothetical protein